MARQVNTVAEEKHGTEPSTKIHKKHLVHGVCLNVVHEGDSGTCEVADRLQFERLQDCFERGHLQVDLLVDLHIVVFKVVFLNTHEDDD